MAHDAPLAIPRASFGHRFMNALKRFFAKLLGATEPDPLEAHDETFAPIDVDAVCAELRLQEEAARFGTHNLPRHDDIAPDGPQVRIEQYVTERVDTAFRLANTERQRLTDALRHRGVQDHADGADRLSDEVLQLARLELRQAHNHIRSFEARRDEIRDRLADYRERHGLRRGPDLREPHERKALLTWTILLAMGQATANATLFAQGMPLGLSAGLLLAVMLGFFDIIFHFWTGRLATRIHGHDLSSRVLGAIGCVIILFVLPLYNLGLVHLRLGIRNLGFEDGVELWLVNMRTDPVGFADFGSFALLTVGLFCSILAVVTAWEWDERIPTYRQLGHDLRNTDGSLGFWQDQLDRIRDTEFAVGRDRFDRLLRDADHGVNTCSAILERMSRLRQNLDVFVRDAQNAYATLIRRYRDENLLAREDDPPPYFRDAPKLTIISPLPVDVEDMRTFVQEQVRLTARIRSLADGFRDRLSASLADEASDVTGRHE